MSICSKVRGRMKQSSEMGGEEGLRVEQCPGSRLPAAVPVWSPNPPVQGLPRHTVGQAVGHGHPHRAVLACPQVTLRPLASMGSAEAGWSYSTASTGRCRRRHRFISVNTVRTARWSDSAEEKNQCGMQTTQLISFLILNFPGESHVY